VDERAADVGAAPRRPLVGVHGRADASCTSSTAAATDGICIFLGDAAQSHACPNMF
jgi:hypothetical protein